MRRSADLAYTIKVSRSASTGMCARAHVHARVRVCEVHAYAL